MANPYLNTVYWAAATVLFIIITSLISGASARFVVKIRGGTKKLQERAFAGYLFAAPWVVGFLIFVLIPMVLSLYWSFNKVEPLKPVIWVGLKNYLDLFGDSDFKYAFLNSLFITVIGLPLQIGAALILALLLSQKLRGMRLFRVAFYMPVVLGLNSAVLLCWGLMFNANNGIVTQIIQGLGQIFVPFNWLDRLFIYINELISAAFLGFQSGRYKILQNVISAGFPAADRVPLWLQSPLWTKTSLIILLIWSCGTMMIFYLAALNNVPQEIYEAAEVDGANAWQRFWNVTWPLITPYTFYNLIVGMIAIIQLFNEPYVLFYNTPTVAQSAQSVVYYLYINTFRFNRMGYGSAISWFLLIVIMFITLIQFRLQNRWVQYDLR
ncbi:MAG TPA: sugar ABC transporter permease [Anaerolineales bacterium]|nr:sugar ABC transporter permease [Anaerolineales bacterium]